MVLVLDKKHEEMKTPFVLEDFNISQDLEKRLKEGYRKLLVLVGPAGCGNTFSVHLAQEGISKETCKNLANSAAWLSI